MKQIIAYVRLAVLESVIEALIRIDGLPGMEIKGFEQGKDVSRQDERDVEGTYFGKKVRIELMVPDAIVRQVVDTFRTMAWAGDRDSSDSCFRIARYGSSSATRPG